MTPEQQTALLKSQARYKFPQLLDGMDASLKVMPMPENTNGNGDIFGGWLMSQADLAGCIPANRIAQGKVVTVAVKSFEFHSPVFVGDVVCCYTRVQKVGTTSVAIQVEMLSERFDPADAYRVASAELIYVAIDGDGGKRVIPK